MESVRCWQRSDWGSELVIARFLFLEAFVRVVAKPHVPLQANRQNAATIKT